MIDVLEPGFAPHTVPYRQGWELQRRIHAEVVEGSREETLILLEHEAVFTAGSRTEDGERPRPSGTPVIDVDRGGKITWHGPGQLIGYPIMRVADRGDAVACVRSIEQMLIELIAPYGVTGMRVEGRSGVWVERDNGAADKIAAIGMRVSRGVTMHGFALNCNHSLAPYDEIVACGIRDAGVTTIARETGGDISPADLAGTTASAFRNTFERIPA
ncbi:lipoyl(octanoyl) transferase LipB [Microbacterium halotolerans]|uniref:lipoyl(octanoyl) transferase LipB n=1 Tax=Microbacterium halotolerans TaxID=246613 RepID=UPI000E6ABEA6|nr:lipoyl(octanoyl) transferase LipB [Microbacterium halotolerans]